MPKVAILQVGLILSVIISCQHLKPQNEQEITQLREVTAVGAEAAKLRCASCHLLPDPCLLNKATWHKHVLPRMGYFLGIYPDDSTRTSLIENGPGGTLVHDAHIFPEKPLINDEEWEAIRQYYLQQAPDNLETIKWEKPEDTIAGFKVTISPFRLSPPSTTFIQAIDHGVLIGDANTKKLYQLDEKLNLAKAANVKEGLVSGTLEDRRMLLTIMGSFSPTDNPLGFVMELPVSQPKLPKILVKNLQRPVHTSFSDLNGDGMEDMIICEFAKWTGCLAWWQNLGNDRYEKHILRNKPGAIKTIVRDFNDDGQMDIMALFGQGDEGIFLYTNLGNGNFSEKPVIRFPPSYGSSYFDLVDVNQDGFEDIVYTAGDNADYPPVTKPYHGIYIYLNDGNHQFTDSFFYHLPGAYQARLVDFDQDGDLDITAISFFPEFNQHPDQSFVYLENQGNFNFKPFTFPQADRGRWLVMDTGDYDQDGDEDILLGSLAFEVVPPTHHLQQWISEGIPFLILQNQLHHQ